MRSKRLLVFIVIGLLAFTAMAKNPPKLRGPKPAADASGKPRDDDHVAPSRGSRTYPWHPGMDASRLPLPSVVEAREHSPRVGLAWMNPTVLAVGPSIVWVNNIEVSNSPNDPDFEVATAVLTQMVWSMLRTRGLRRRITAHRRSRFGRHATSLLRLTRRGHRLQARRAIPIVLIPCWQETRTALASDPMECTLLTCATTRLEALLPIPRAFSCGSPSMRAGYGKGALP